MTNYKIYLILVKDSEPSVSIKEKIKALGESYIFWNNHWLLTAPLTAKEIYEWLQEGNDSKVSMLISEFIPENYYGRMPPTIWSWIKEQKIRIS